MNRIRERILTIDETNPRVKAMAEDTMLWLCRLTANQKEARRINVVCGPNGIGKTHMLKACYKFVRAHSVDLWANHLWSKPPRTSYFAWTTISKAEDRESFASIMDEIQSSHAIFIDDIGADVDRFKSGMPNQQLTETLNAVDNRWLMITTNIPKPSWETMFGPRNADRLYKSTYFDGRGIPSYRSQ